MLVLTRKIDESIRIGDDVVVTVTRLMGDSVRLGIVAPQNVPIVRSEIDVAGAIDDDVPIFRIQDALDARENQRKHSGRRPQR